MALDQKKIAIGLADVQIAAWVANGGGTGHVSVGILKDPPEESHTFTNVKPTFESLPSAPLSFPQIDERQLKISISECSMTNLQWALGQPAGSLTGTEPNTTLLIGDREEQYKSIKIVATGGSGATGVRTTETHTYHRCAVSKIETITYARLKERNYVITFDWLYDTSVTTADKFGKVVCAGGS
jgi:hypothetical protein